jgi:hypothetical protein
VKVAEASRLRSGVEDQQRDAAAIFEKIDKDFMLGLGLSADCEH